jgi:glycosyltransferase involved in cell wall biosynthesis
MLKNKLKNNPLISIVLPVYNGEKYLSQSIESCLNQTYTNIELIIVNDCSTDGSLNIANSYDEKDIRVRIINNVVNSKLPASLNIGHNEAKGHFITWTSHDNFYELNSIQELLNEIIENKADIVYSNFAVIDNENTVLREVQYPGIENIIFGNVVGCCFLYKKEVFIRNKGYDEHFFLIEDYDFWLRAAVHSRYFHLKKSLYNYRKHDESLTRRIFDNAVDNVLWMENVKKMYAHFCKTISEDNYLFVAEWLFKNLTYQLIDFDWIVKNHKNTSSFKAKLKQNQNFSNGNLIEKIFLEKTIEIMVADQEGKSNFLKSIFIIKKYVKVLYKNAFKTLIKYSFFK